MTARVHSAILYRQSSRSGNWICEIHDCNTGNFVAIGIGPTKLLAQARAAAVAQSQEKVAVSFVPNVSLEQVDDVATDFFNRLNTPTNMQAPA